MKTLNSAKRLIFLFFNLQSLFLKRKSIIIIGLFLFANNLNAAVLYFNKVYKASGSGYTVNTQSLSSITGISGTSFKFTSAIPTATTFNSGNNENGILSYVNNSGQQVSIYGTISRQNKVSGNTLAVNFITTDSNYVTGVSAEAYILVVPGKESSFANNDTVGTSSDPIGSVLNGILATQSSSPIITITNPTVVENSGYATFTISLTNTASASISFTPTLSNVTAALNSDYTNSIEYYDTSINTWVAISTSVTIAQNVTSLQIRVPILDDLISEQTETFNLTTGAITGGNVLNNYGVTGVVSIVDDEISADPTKSTIVANPTSIIANGTSTSTITVQLKDGANANLSASGGTVVVTTTSGTLGTVTNNNNGTYTVTLTSSTNAGTATLGFSINGTTANATTTVAFTADPTKSTIVANPTSIIANGTSTSTITVQLKDGANANLSASGGTVVVTTTSGTLGTVTNNNNGTYTVTLTSSTNAGTATLGFSINGTTANATTTVAFTADPTKSTIVANPTSIIANGTSTSTITVQLKDGANANLSASGGTVVVTTTSGTLGTVTNNNNGTYTVTLTSSSTSGTATLGFSINGTTATATATVVFSASSTPAITNSASSLSAFTSCQGSVSTAQSFTVSGTNLTSNVTVTAPSGYEVSVTSGSGYGATVTINASGTLAATTVYVRMTALATGTPSGNVTVVSGAASQNVEVTGTVTSLPNVQFKLSPPNVTTSAIQGQTGSRTENFNALNLGNLSATGTFAIGAFTRSNTGSVTVMADDVWGGSGSQYLQAANSGQVSIILTDPSRYVGFWWAAGNANNNVTIYGSCGGNEIQLGTFTAQTVLNLLTGASVTAVNGTAYNSSLYKRSAAANEAFAYINLELDDPTIYFTRIVFGGSGFEFDNITTAVGYGAASATTPSAPTITTITNTGGTATINFTAPTSNGGSVITNYEYTTDGGTTWVAFSPVTTSSPVTVSGLTNGTTYPFQLRAVNAIGSGTASNTISTTVNSGATLAPVLTSPVTNSTVFTTFQINYTLPEAPLAGSVRLTFSPTAGGTPIVWTMNNSTTANFAYVIGSNPTIISNVVSGAVVPSATYDVTLSYQNAFGNPSASVTNTNIQSLAPPNITLPQSNYTGAPNSNLTAITPQNTGGTATFTISPALPNGVSINAVTGEITGRPTATIATTSFTITATNAAGTSTVSFNLIIDQDTDGDGILDSTDTDDDNDGLMDYQEQDCSASTAVSQSLTPSTFYFVQWNSYTNGVLSGVINVPGNPVNVTVTNTSNSILLQNDAPYGGISNWSPQPSGNANLSTFRSNTLGEHKFVFDQPVNNPRFFINSLNRTLDLSLPGKVLNSNGNFTGAPVGTTTQVLVGNEGTGTISFSGNVSEISFTGRATEFYCNFSLGIAGIVDANACVDIDTDGDGTPNRLDLESDGDGVLDATENADGTDEKDFCKFVLAHQTVTTSAAWNAADCDNDGVTNADELTDGTNPLNPDSDGDGVKDGTEKTDGTDAKDGCKFVLANQTVATSTAWNAADCDGDGTTNRQEILNNTDPLVGDTDGDGVLDPQEIIDGTSRTDSCDFILASQTIATSSAWNTADCDNDGVTNADELTEGTDPLKSDTDGDGVIDGTEQTDETDAKDGCKFVFENQTVATSTAWNTADCDNDGVTNADELTDGTDPLKSDTDGDGVIDGTEKTDGTSGTNSCEFILASQTIATSSAWNTADCDNDGVTNADELTEGTDPLKSDTDGDGVIDGTEKTDGTSGTNSCKFLLVNRTVTPSSAWNAADCDGDGISNGTEGIVDTDNDGTPDFKDLNSDNDGITDAIEKGSGATPLDTDNDGTPDYRDLDSDNDGLTDAIEKGSGATPLDTDNDGTSDYRDLDSDNDGLNDAVEKGSGTTPMDSDRDGTPDYRDLDSDNDGLTDAVEKGGGTTPIDTDRDGTPDYLDLDADGDGILDRNDAFPKNPLEWTDTDRDGIGNNADIDDDNDGILDACDVDTNGDGIPDNGSDMDADGINDGCDTDKDGDGVNNISDNCPNSPNTDQADRDRDGKGDVCDTVEINVSQAITPNGDGVNDTWVVYNLSNYPGSIVRVFNRWGKEVFYSNDYQNNWTGHYKDNSEKLPPSGSYFYQIDLKGDGSIDAQGWLYITQ